MDEVLGFDDDCLFVCEAEVSVSVSVSVDFAAVFVNMFFTRGDSGRLSTGEKNISLPEDSRCSSAGVLIDRSGSGEDVESFVDEVTDGGNGEKGEEVDTELR